MRAWDFHHQIVLDRANDHVRGSASAHDVDPFLATLVDAEEGFDLRHRITMKPPSPGRGYTKNETSSTLPFQTDFSAESASRPLTRASTKHANRRLTSPKGR